MAWRSSFDRIVKPMQEAVDELPNPIGWPYFKEISIEEAKDRWPDPKELVGWDLGNGADKTVVVSVDKEKVHVVELYSKTAKHNNKVPTHDPYTNPNAHIYYECKCGQILDPGTKRFAELNNCASNAGWKIRFSDTGYIPYCVDCGKGVE